MLKRIELSGFKSFAKSVKLEFPASITAVVGPNGSGKSNVAESLRWVLGEQSIKSLRGKKGEDLIFNGSQTAPRLGKASVSIVFDNKGKVFPVDYEEVKISRKVFRDGVNEYLINDSQVRHKDIVEMLSQVGLGTSSHHIISQGEADRILNSSLKERRQMIEDALGLKIYQIKKNESERKLERTEENMGQVEALKKEIQPHLKFLQKQVKKAEESISLKENLRNFYKDYFSKENFYLKNEESVIRSKEEKINEEISAITKESSNSPEDSSVAKVKKEIEDDKIIIATKEKETNDLRLERNTVERELGRLEGMMEAVEIKNDQEDKMVLPSGEVKNFISEIEVQIKDCLDGDNIDDIKNTLGNIKKIILTFSEKLTSGIKVPTDDLDKIRGKQKETLDALEKIKIKEEELLGQRTMLAKGLEEKQINLQNLEKKKYEMEGRLKELRGILDGLNIKKETLKIQKDDLGRETDEAKALIGDIEFEKRENADEQWVIERNGIRREIERTKIKLEDSGFIGDDALKEYEEVKKRNDFFEKELGDLEMSIKSLKDLLAELDEKINQDFKVGIEKINKEFQNFFTTMFGGGKAELRVVAPKKRAKKETEETENLGGLEENEAVEEGIDVYVNLPKKRIHSLDMLSGGERALTSIALLFAMSQVNPPPFLVLDETDAALDEANSRKYGEMLSKLSESTQLIVITHNRETMNQAGILYGVTMGSDSISKILSIKFTEAEQYTNRS